MSEPEDFDLALHQALVRRLREAGPASVEWLAQRCRRDCRDARICAERVVDTIEHSAVIVGLPDGRAAHLLDVLRGSIFTQRVRSPLRDRTDLWSHLALQPLLSILLVDTLPLTGGGVLRGADFGHNAIVGPAGWLPSADPGDLIGVRVGADGLRVERVDPDTLPGPEDEQRVRALLAQHYRTERWWSGSEDLESRPAELTRAIGHALLEVPDLFATPQRPLNELLYDALQQDQEDHHWRDFNACQQGETVSFYVTGMPSALHAELDRRAGHYGMSHDQMVVAMLSHLAWRTPFAEDMEPWESWLPDHLRTEHDEQPARASLSLLPGQAGELSDTAE